MEIAALVLAVVALVVAYLAIRQAGGLKEQVAQAANAVSELRGTLSATQKELEGKLTDLVLAQRRQAGEAIFDPAMTIAEAMKVHPRVAEVLAGFNLGGCPNCAVSDVDTIEGACQTYGVDQAALMKALYALVGGSSGAAGPTKAPNVKADF